MSIIEISNFTGMIIGFLILAWFVAKLITRFFNVSNFNEGNIEQKFYREKWPYKKKDYLLSVSERKFYEVLKQVVDDQWLIFSKVRVADVLVAPREHVYNKTFWYKIQAKHIDYLLCTTKYVSPVLAIELDGSSHDSPKAEKNDEFKNQAFEDAGLPLLRISRAEYYDHTRLKELIGEKLNNFTS